MPGNTSASSLKHHTASLKCLGASLWLGLLLAACASTGPATAPAPEAASGLNAKPGWTLQRQAVAAANPLATEAGVAILRAGGSAVDAAVAKGWLDEGTVMCVPQ